MQFVKFGMVGVTNTVVGLGIYYTVVFIGIHYILANLMAFVLSVLNSFLWNRKFVFKTAAKQTMRQISRVYCAYGTTGLLDTGMLFIMVDFIGISELVAPLINLVWTIPLNFILNKYWVFGK